MVQFLKFILNIFLSCSTHLITIFPSNSGHHIAQSAQQQRRNGRLLAEQCGQGKDNGDSQRSPLPAEHVPAVGEVSKQVTHTSSHICSSHQSGHRFRVDGMHGEERQRPELQLERAGEHDQLAPPVQWPGSGAAR